MLGQCFLFCLLVQINPKINSDPPRPRSSTLPHSEMSTNAAPARQNMVPLMASAVPLSLLIWTAGSTPCAKGWELNQRCGIIWCLGLLYLPSGKLTVCELENHHFEEGNQHQSTINVRFSIAVQLPESKSWHLFSHRVWEAPQTSPARLELLE